jgi:hypothetical protein
MASNVVINGVTYSSVPEVQIPRSGGGTARFYDSADATASAGDILSGKTAYIADGKQTGSMANNGATGGVISTKNGSVTIPAGYTSGGTVAIDSTEQAKIIAANIKSGVTILGVAGSASVIDTTIATSAADTTKILTGYKAYVNGSLVTGSYTAPSVSQNSTTKVLSIA